MAHIPPLACDKPPIPGGRCEAQDLLRHTNSRITLDIYTQAVSEQKRDACSRVVEMMLGSQEDIQGQHPWVANNYMLKPVNHLFLLSYGGRCRIRTCDFHRVKVALYR